MRNLKEEINNLRVKSINLTRLAQNTPYGKAIELREEQKKTYDKMEFLLKMKRIIEVNNEK